MYFDLLDLFPIRLNKIKIHMNNSVGTHKKVIINTIQKARYFVNYDGTYMHIMYIYIT